jgi:transposase
MKDGRTHLGYKAEHTVDLETEFVLSATVQHGTEPDSITLCDAVVDAQENLERAGSDAVIADVAADKGYHSNAQLAGCNDLGIRTYIPEPSAPHRRKWSDKCDEVRRAVINNRSRLRRQKGRNMQRLRSERVEWSFAHLCETGGARRTWLRGLEKINKRYSVVVAHNLGLLMRKLFGTGKPRGFAALWLLQAVCIALRAALSAIRSILDNFNLTGPHNAPDTICRTTPVTACMAP